jgi:hypothetical protein
MMYYCEYIPERDERRVCEYNEKKHGLPVRLNKYNNSFMLFGRCLIVDGIYNSIDEALRNGWKAWSKKPVILPDETIVIPAEYFGYTDIYNIFISYYEIEGEKWPSEIREE